MRKIRVGLIGLGGNGKAFLKGYQEHPLATLMAICDLSPQKVREVARDFKIKKGYTNYHLMLKEEKIDMVSIHTPDHLQARPFIDSLNAGKHVFVEKPMANDIEDLRKMVRVADKAERMGLKTMVGQILRFNPLFQKIKSIVDKGILGKIFYMEGDYIHNLRSQAGKERYNKYIKMNWWLEKEKPMVGGGCHPLDLLRWFKGKEIIEVKSYSNRIAFPQMKNDDCIVSLFKFSDGCIAKVTALYAPVSSYAYANNIALYGTKGTILQDKICLDEKKGFKKIPASWLGGHPFDPEQDHFLKCILKDKKSLVDAHDGAGSAAAVIAATQSAQKKQFLPVPKF